MLDGPEVDLNPSPEAEAGCLLCPPKAPEMLGRVTKAPVGGMGIKSIQYLSFSPAPGLKLQIVSCRLLEEKRPFLLCPGGSTG